MLTPPGLRSAPYYPVTSSISLAAIGLTLLWWSKMPMDEFFMDHQVWEKWQLWRALSATLLHVNVFHLAFNLYWFWTFGTLVERVFGHVRCAAIFLLLGFGSMLAEYTVLSGGVGLSGVGYGLWGMLWVLEKRDDRFHDAVDDRTSQMFVGWFFLCILLTVTGVMPVANVAHGVGALLGVLLGLAICGRRQVQRECIAGIGVVMLIGFLGSTVYWPSLNFSETAEAQVEQAGLAALDKHDNARGVHLLERAVKLRHAPARAWYNLGVAYLRANKYEAAFVALKHAATMPDADDHMRGVARTLESPVVPGMPPPAVMTNR